MPKKKKYTPREDDDWDIEEAKEHRRIIAEKSKKIAEKYKKWWDSDKHRWKDGFSH
tara:strand:- start:22 stop:189 length:168 start_codon:yes stop_codon:yes gene_type:complete